MILNKNLMLTKNKRIQVKAHELWGFCKGFSY